MTENTNPDWFEAKADQEIGWPVDHDGRGCGGRPTILGEKFSDEEPGDGSGSDGKSNDKQNDHRNGNVRQNGVFDHQANQKHDGGDQHDRQAGDHQGFPACLFDQDQWDYSHSDVAGSHAQRCPLGNRFSQSSRGKDWSRVKYCLRIDEKLIGC